MSEYGTRQRTAAIVAFIERNFSVPVEDDEDDACNLMRLTEKTRAYLISAYNAMSQYMGYSVVPYARVSIIDSKSLPTTDAATLNVLFVDALRKRGNHCIDFLLELTHVLRMMRNDRPPRDMQEYYSIASTQWLSLDALRNYYYVDATRMKLRLTPTPYGTKDTAHVDAQTFGISGLMCLSTDSRTVQHLQRVGRHVPIDGFRSVVFLRANVSEQRDARQVFLITLRRTFNVCIISQSESGQFAFERWMVDRRETRHPYTEPYAREPRGCNCGLAFIGERRVRDIAASCDDTFVLTAPIVPVVAYELFSPNIFKYNNVPMETIGEVADTNEPSVARIVIVLRGTTMTGNARRNVYVRVVVDENFVRVSTDALQSFGSMYSMKNAVRGDMLNNAYMGMNVQWKTARVSRFIVQFSAPELYRMHYVPIFRANAVHTLRLVLGQRVLQLSVPEAFRTRNARRFFLRLPVLHKDDSVYMSVLSSMYLYIVMERYDDVYRVSFEDIMARGARELTDEVLDDVNTHHIWQFVHRFPVPLQSLSVVTTNAPISVGATVRLLPFRVDVLVAHDIHACIAYVMTRAANLRASTGNDDDDDDEDSEADALNLVTLPHRVTQYSEGNELRLSAKCSAGEWFADLQPRVKTMNAADVTNALSEAVNSYTPNTREAVTVDNAVYAYWFSDIRQLMLADLLNIEAMTARRLLVPMHVCRQTLLRVYYTGTPYEFKSASDDAIRELVDQNALPPIVFASAIFKTTSADALLLFPLRSMFIMALAPARFIGYYSAASRAFFRRVLVDKSITNPDDCVKFVLHYGIDAFCDNKLSHMLRVAYETKSDVLLEFIRTVFFSPSICTQSLRFKYAHLLAARNDLIDVHMTPTHVSMAAASGFFIDLAANHEIVQCIDANDAETFSILQHALCPVLLRFANVERKNLLTYALERGLYEFVWNVLQQSSLWQVTVTHRCVVFREMFEIFMRNADVEQLRRLLSPAGLGPDVKNSYHAEIMSTYGQDVMSKLDEGDNLRGHLLRLSTFVRQNASKYVNARLRSTSTFAETDNVLYAYLSNDSTRLDTSLFEILFAAEVFDVNNVMLAGYDTSPIEIVRSFPDSMPSMHDVTPPNRYGVENVHFDDDIRGIRDLRFFYELLSVDNATKTISIAHMLAYFDRDDLFARWHTVDSKTCLLACEQLYTQTGARVVHYACMNVHKTTRVLEWLQAHVQNAFDARYRFYGLSCAHAACGGQNLRAYELTSTRTNDVFCNYNHNDLYYVLAYTTFPHTVVDALLDANEAADVLDAENMFVGIEATRESANLARNIFTRTLLSNPIVEAVTQTMYKFSWNERMESIDNSESAWNTTGRLENVVDWHELNEKVQEMQ